MLIHPLPPQTVYVCVVCVRVCACVCACVCVCVLGLLIGSVLLWEHGNLALVGAWGANDCWMLHLVHLSVFEMAQWGKKKKPKKQENGGYKKKQV